MQHVLFTGPSIQPRLVTSICSYIRIQSKRFHHDTVILLCQFGFLNKIWLMFKNNKKQGEETVSNKKLGKGSTLEYNIEHSLRIVIEHDILP